MNSVANDFNADVLIQHTGPDESNLAVVLWTHLIAEVRETPQTGSFCLAEILRRGSGVSGGARNARRRRFRDEVDCSRHFRRQGDIQNRVDGVQHHEFLKIRRTNKGGVLCATLLRIDVGSFQMHSRRLGTIRTRGVFLHASADICQGVRPERQSRGQPGRHTFLHLAIRNSSDALNLAIAGVASSRPVGVDIDESRHKHLSADILRGISRRCFVRLQNCSDFIVLQQDAAAFDVDSRGDNMRVGYEGFHKRIIEEICGLFCRSLILRAGRRAFKSNIAFRVFAQSDKNECTERGKRGEEIYRLDKNSVP